MMHVSISSSTAALADCESSLFTLIASFLFEEHHLSNLTAFLTLFFELHGSITPFSCIHCTSSKTVGIPVSPKP